MAILSTYNTISADEWGRVESWGGSVTSRERDNRRISDIKQLQLALELYYDRHGKYPPGFNDKDTQPPGAPGALGVLWSEGFVVAFLPRDPLTETPYMYGSRNGGTGYLLSTVLEDKTHSALSNDIDENVNVDNGSIGCADQGGIYCVSESGGVSVGTSYSESSLEESRKKARDDRRVSDVKQLQLALELYYDAHGQYASTLEPSLVGEGFISLIPKDPLDLTAYPYDQMNAGTSYELGANLETQSSYLQSDYDTVSVGGNVTSGDDFRSCSGAISRYCYNVSP